MLIENTSRSVRRAPEEHNKKKYPYGCDVINSPFFSKKYVSPSLTPCYLFFFSPLTFRSKPLEFNFFSNRSFQKLVTTCFVHQKCQKTFFFTTPYEYFCYSIAGLHARLFNYVQNPAEASGEVFLQPQKHGAPTRFGGRVWRIHQLHSQRTQQPLRSRTSS